MESPPHLTSSGTLVPLTYFVKARGKRSVWNVSTLGHVDLVPVEQSDLLQDTPFEVGLDALQSGDARACGSLCRPCGAFIDKRQLRHGGRVAETMPHQTGELQLRPLIVRQDEARGMLGSLVSSPAFENDKLRLKDEEVAVLRSSLSWLKIHNPWFTAYASALADASSCYEVCKDLANSGRIIASAPAS